VKFCTMRSEPPKFDDGHQVIGGDVESINFCGGSAGEICQAAPEELSKKRTR